MCLFDTLQLLLMAFCMFLQYSDLASIIDGLIAGNVEKIPPSSVIKQLGVAIE